MLPSYQAFTHHIKKCFMRTVIVLNGQVLSLLCLAGPALLCYTVCDNVSQETLWLNKS